MFNRCVKSNGLPVDHPQYGITLNYEFLDDVSDEWAGLMTSETSVHEGSGVDTMMYKIKSALPENASKQVEIKSNHPLMLMVRKDRIGNILGGDILTQTPGSFGSRYKSFLLERLRDEPKQRDV